jgi:hypothetical protein
MRIKVVWSPAARRIERVALELPEGATVAEALAASGLPAPAASAVDAPAQPAGGVGVWGEPCPPTRVLREGDRVELYRPLQVDPKEARRLRQQAQARDGAAAGPGRGRPRGRPRPLSGS